jgi:hypothetical protein
MEAVSGEKVIFEKAAISDTDRGKEMNFFLCFWRTSSCGKGLK